MRCGFGIDSGRYYCRLYALCKEPATTQDGENVDLMKYASPPLFLTQKGWYVYPPPDMVRIPHDAFVRWKGDHRDMPYGPAEWFWNGQSVGVGRKGWKNIGDKLRAMPKGSKVLFFPRLYVATGVSTSRTSTSGPPWVDSSFHELVSMRELVAIFSIRDEKGKVCPILRTQYERWESMQGKPVPTR